MIETVDLPERIREVASARLLATGEPVSGETISADLGPSAAAVEAAIETLSAAGWVDRNEGGMIAGGDDLRADFCTPTVLPCSLEHGREWSRRQADNGQLVLLATAADEGRQRWAGCARAARRLGQEE